MARVRRRKTAAKGRRSRRKVVKRARRVPRARRVKRATPRRRLAGANQAVITLRACAAALIAERNQLDSQIQVVEKALLVMGAAAPAGRAIGRPVGRRAAGGPRPGSLKDHILNVLSGGGVMSVKDVASGVLAGGYKTRNKTLAKSVGIALADMPNVRKVARGKFRLK